MGNFNQRGNKFGGKKSFGGGGFRGHEHGDRSQMFKATCAECGKECEVPFKPSGNKPVYCSNCFGKKEGGGNDRFEKRGNDHFSFGDKQMFKAICDNCGQTCEVPFKPSGDKPVYCKDCFGKNDKGAGASSAKIDQYRKEFASLNSKLDDILKLLAAKTVKAAPVKDKKIVVKKKPAFAKATVGKKKK